MVRARANVRPKADWTPDSAETSHADLKHRESRHTFDLLVQEEQTRKARLEALLARHDADESAEKVWEEQDRCDAIRADAEQWRIQAHQMEQKAQRALLEVQSCQRELQALKVEMSSVQEESQDSAKVLSEKLALAREIAQMKPELEDLRSQTKLHEGLLGEKFELQRELQMVRAELQAEKKASKKYAIRQDKFDQLNSNREADMDEIKSQLVQAKKGASEMEVQIRQEEASRLAALQAELESARQALIRLEVTTGTAETEKIEALQTALSEERRLRKAAEKATKTAGSLDDLRKQLASEAKARKELEKEASRSRSEWNQEKEVLEDKIEQTRNRLRSTKERLKDTEAELRDARNVPVSKAPAAMKQNGNARKRVAAVSNLDGALGTPGDDRLAAKRSKRASSVLGEKSTFSITPFLNRTSNAGTEEHPEDHDQDTPLASIEDVDSPAAVRGNTAAQEQTKRPALGLAAPGKSNLRVKQLRTKELAKPSLEVVAEEDGIDNDATVQPSGKPAARKTASAKPQLKLKASSVAPSREASVQPLQKKVRRLVGTRTLFDEDEDEGNAPAYKRPQGGPRAFGTLGSHGFGGLTALNAGRRKGLLVVKEDGFAFSPLKKDRKALAAATTSTILEA